MSPSVSGGRSPAAARAPAAGGGPPRRLVWQRLRRDRGALCGGTVLVVLLLVALGAEFIAPYRQDTQRRDLAFHPPMLRQLGFAEGAVLPRLAVAGVQVVDPQRKQYAAGPERWPIRLFVRGEPYRLWGLLPCERHLFGVDPGGVLFVLGSDQFGRDLLSRLLHATRVSLGVALLAVFLSLALGLLLGGLAGYAGGWLDFLLMRGTELVLALPGLYLLLALRDSFGRELSPWALLGVLALVLALVEWAPHARVIRGLVLALRDREHVRAARVQGFGPASLLVRQILPGTSSYVIPNLSLSLPAFVLNEAALSFLGLGVQEPQASWGLLLRDAQSVRFLVDFPWLLAPGGFLFLAVAACNLLGEGLRDALDLQGVRG
ncbi:MAG: ABC transporter permease [Myxococcota bacterium]|jgi:peptide/nickel transport system permease protein|nr:ABC transporter permease [Myxococcota bacterium]